MRMSNGISSPARTPITMTTAYRINSKPGLKANAKHQKRGGKAADDAEKKLNPYEAIREATVDVAGESAADAHRERYVPMMVEN